MALSDIFYRGIGASIALAAFFALPRLVEPAWPRVVEAFGSEWNLYVWGTYAATMIPVVLGNLAWALVYWLRLPWLEQWKVNADPWPWTLGASQSAEFYKLLRTSALLTIVNPTLIMLPLTMLNFDTAKRLGYRSSGFPSVWEVVSCLLVSALIEDACFYWGHRTLHGGQFYAKIHKMHHDYKYTVSLAVLHLHPVEFVLANVIPVAAGPLLTGAHAYTALLWIVLRVLQTQEAHSGYAFPWSPFRLLPLNGSGKSHEAHHSINTGNFGSLFGVWDRICGTTIDSEVIARNFEKNRGLEDAAQAAGKGGKSS